MELVQTVSHYIVRQGENSLWCNRSNGNLEPRTGEEPDKALNPLCLGEIYGVIGKVKLHPDCEWRLILIKKRSLACRLADTHNIYKIDKVAILPLSNQEVNDLDLEICKKHQNDKGPQQSDNNQSSLRGTWNSIKSAAENVKPKKKENKEREKFEKRILEELLKMFNDSDSFYYSDNHDITNSLQRQHSPSYNASIPLWKRADDRFFWNKHMLLELVEGQVGLADIWVIPVIQGYVQMEKCLMAFDEDVNSSDPSDWPSVHERKLDPLDYKICIISRRSRHRAGTRSRKRGLDASGACANYVETEQIIEFAPHLVSFVQVRGSIPVFWSQSGFKYRPPPRLDEDEKASYEAFSKHIQEQLDIYSKMAIVSLAELAGKEHVLGDAFLSNVLTLNSSDLTYITFDFHEYCRGMRFENVSILTDGIKDLIKDMRYTWVDNKGVICEQRGIFRVNCVDCLDRTNVVMTAVARIVMESQFRKLGLLPPEETLPRSCRLTYQQLWANNGDAISRQYAGTAALKGDFTRTGERKFTGVMKDGVNSANRYYLRFNDAYRQAAIDITLGQPISDAMLVPSVEVDEAETQDTLEKEENMNMMIEDCKRMLIIEPEYCIGGWGLINADPITGDSDRLDVDIVFLLSQRSVYVAWYDDEEEQVTQYQRIFLEDIDKIEIGMEPALFKSRFLCLRLIYHYQTDEGLFHTWRLANLRLPNKSVAVHLQEETKEKLCAIAETVKSAQDIMSLELEIEERPKLERRKAAPHPEVMDIHQQQQENSLTLISLPRDVSSDLRSSTSSLKDPTSTSHQESCQARSKSPILSRSKSPISFLENIPKPSLRKPTLPSFSTTQNFNFSDISGKLNPFAKSLSRPIHVTSLPHAEAHGKNSKLDKGEAVIGNQSFTQVTIPSSSESDQKADNQGVLMPSCGILATSSKQLIRSSIHLKSERLSMDMESFPDPACTDESSPTAATSCQPSQQDHGLVEANQSENDESQTLPQTTEIHNAELFCNSDDITSESIGELDHGDDYKDKHFSGDEGFPSQNVRDETEEDEEYCIVENNKVCAIVKKSQLLQHPSMKLSLSDSSLSHTHLQEQTEPGTNNFLNANDSSLMSKFKMKMSNLSKGPSNKPQESSMHTKNHIKKSQRAVEVFEQLMKEKLTGSECKTRFIFI